MGVYIPTMKKPETCSECPFCQTYKQSSNYCHVLEADISTFTATHGRSLGCPLVEVNTNWGIGRAII